jgi:hypothetical protein
VNVRSHKFQKVLNVLGRILYSNWPQEFPENPHPETINPQDNQESAVIGGRLISRQPIYSGFGVGIHLGEAVALRRWALSSPPIWLVYNLQSENLSQIEARLYQQLRFLACLLEACYKQPSLWTNYWSKRGEIEVGMCQQQFLQHEDKLLPSEAEQNNPALGNLEQKRKLTRQSKQEGKPLCLDCPLWQVYQASFAGSNERQTET